MWEARYAKRFLKELAKLPRPLRTHIERIAFHELPDMTDPTKHTGLERLTGYPGCAKIRVRDYRIGILIDRRNKQMILCRVRHRRDMYRYFP